MNEIEARTDLRAIIAGLGVKWGATIFLGIDMGHLPLPSYQAELNLAAIRHREERWCSFILSELLEALGPDGTLIVPAYSYRCANPANTFVLENTPSEVGRFTEFFRKQPNVLRSLHPIFSVCAIGRNAKAVTENTGGSAFGPMSPFGRLNALGARFISLGVAFRNSVTYLHHLEQCYGCPHRYNKILTGPVFAGEARITRPFQAYMRYLGNDAEADFARAEAGMKSAGVLTEVVWRGAVSHAVDVCDVDRIGFAMLAEDPFAFSSRRVCIDMDARHIDTPSSAKHIVFKMVPKGEL
jgi:aminoglycoside N3'-acetyltransferase